MQLSNCFNHQAVTIRSCFLLETITTRSKKDKQLTHIREVAQIDSITIDDKPLKMLSSGKRIVVNYPRKHKEEIILRMKLNS
jgi:hypothetical protein